MNRTLNVGLIGFQHGHQRDYGTALIRHAATRLQAMAAEPEASEFSLEAGRTWAVECGVPFYENCHEMHERHKLDAVSVAVTAKQNPGLVGGLASRRIHVFCEKPVAESPAEFEIMAEKISAEGTVFSFAAAVSVFSNTFRPALARLRRGEIGEPRVAHFRYLQGNGPEYTLSEEACGAVRMAEFANFGPYGILAFDKVFGTPVESVMARFSSALYPHYQRHSLEDLAVVSLKMEGGGVGTLSVGRTTTPMSGADVRMQVMGSKGVLSIEEGNGRAVTLIREPKPVRLVYGVSPVTLLIDDFVRACLEKGTPEISLEQARACVRVQEAVWRSAKEGRPIPLKEI